MRRVTDRQDFESQPVWSPDGRWLAFLTDREPDGNDDLCIGRAAVAYAHPVDDTQNPIRLDGVREILSWEA